MGRIKRIVVPSSQAVVGFMPGNTFYANSNKGSGLGFTIGKEKRNDQFQEADTLQKASTVGSLQGNVSISSH